MAVPEPKRDPEQMEILKLKEIVSSTNERILDVGCGDGRLTRTLARTAEFAIGTDVEYEKLVLGKRGHPETSDLKMAFAAAQAEALPFADRSFELIVFSWSL